MTELLCQAVAIDMFNTLLWTPETPTHLERLAWSFGVGVESLTPIIDECNDDFERGTLDPVARMQLIAQRLGMKPLSDAEAQAFIAQENKAFLSSVVFYDGAIEALDEIRAMGIGVVILSNANPVGVFAATQMGLVEHVDQALFSCEIRVCKPNITAYTKAHQALGVQRSRTFFVGDGGTLELSGAKQARMVPVRVHPWVQGGRENPDLIDFEVVQYIADLPDYIRSIPLPT